MSQLANDTLNKLRVLNGVKFEYSYWNIHTHGFAGQQNTQVDALAMDILLESRPKDDQGNAFVELMQMKPEAITKECLKFLTENDHLLFIDEMESTAEWDSIKKHLLCESTRAYIVVLTRSKNVATYCVDHKEYQLLNLRDLMIKICTYHTTMCNYNNN